MLRSALILSLLWFCGVAAAADVAVPELRSPVTDLTQTLTSAQAATLDQRLREFEARKGSQIALLILPTTQPETLEEYGIRVAEAWQLGRKDVDDGVLLLVAKDDRAVRIEVGYGLEGALPDVIANRIIDQVIVPRFRDGDFFGGIAAGIDRIIAVIEGEPLPAEPQRSVPFESIGQALPLLLMLLFVGSGLLRRMLGSFGGATVTAGLAGVLIWILTSVVALSIVAAIIGFLFTLFGAAGVGRGWTNSRRGGGFGGGGGWRGGGGGGGWSGGGGGFGGGGASGRW